MISILEIIRVVSLQCSMAAEGRFILIKEHAILSEEALSLPPNFSSFGSHLPFGEIK
ncbi:MAG: hypothetical protein M3Y53_08590 [Thermoproteota archaeon]|nr:hypothetical protein [Thermoproteota archaeon]